MIDIHTHILHGIDDGPNTLEESIEIIKQAQKNNITDIVLTPHYIKNSRYNANNSNKSLLLKELKKELKKRNININLYLGNEVYITDEIISLYKEISTINNSRYILIELPLNHKYLFTEKVINELINNHLIPIIAHPERYTKYYKDYHFFETLVEKGCLLQGNIGSLYGIYGLKSKKMLKELLKRNLIHIIASDIHKPTSKIYKKSISKPILKILKKQSKVDDLLINNPKKIINNLDI